MRQANTRRRPPHGRGHPPFGRGSGVDQNQLGQVPNTLNQQVERPTGRDNAYINSLSLAEGEDLGPCPACRIPIRSRGTELAQGKRCGQCNRLFHEGCMKYHRSCHPRVELSIAGDVYRVDCALTDAQLDKVASLYQGLTIVPTGGSSPHPILRTCRLIDEDLALKHLNPTGLVHDVGGNSNRHAKLGRSNIWSTRPNAIPGDQFRLMSASGSYCNHFGQSCRCHVFESAMFIHSIYYIRPTDVCQILRNTTLRRGISVHHLFEGSRGQIAEATWVRTGTQITMNAGQEPYVHDDLSWLSKTHFDDALDSRVLTWRRAYGTSLTHTFEFALVERAELNIAPIPELSLKDALSSDEPSCVDLRGLMARGDAKDYLPDVHTISKILVLPLSVEVVRSAGTLVIPRDLIGSIQLQITGHPKEFDTMRLAMNYAKQYVRELNMTPSQMASIVPMASALALLASADVESSAFGMIRSRRSWFTHFDVFASHGRLRDLAFSRPASASLMWRAAKVALAIIGSAWVYKRIRLSYRPTANVLGMLWNIPIRVLGRLLAYCYSFLRSTRPSTLWQRVYAGFLKRGPTYMTLYGPESVKPALHPSNADERSDVCMSGRTLGPIAPYATFVPARNEEYACKAKFGNQLVGPAIVGYAPVVARACAHNLDVALVNRGLIPCDHDSVLWSSFEKWVKNNIEQVLPGTNDIKFHFDEWVSRFPPRRRDDYREAMNEIIAGRAPSTKDGDSKLFVKRENQLKCTDLGVVPFDCRLISGQSHAHQVLTAQWTYPFNKFLSRSWGLDDFRVGFGPITYASSMNAVGIGRWFESTLLGADTSIIVAGDDLIVYTGRTWMAIDHTRYDAHMHYDAQQLKLWIYAAKGLRTGPVSRQLHRQSKPSGCSRFGHRYTTVGTTQSGASDTSAGNSLVNGLVNYWISNIAKGTTDENIVAHMAISSRLGFPQEGIQTARPEMVDFCSGIFLPSSKGWRLSPKPGRLVAKSFFVTKNMTLVHQHQWLRGLVVGLMPAVSHVPLLSDLFVRLEELTAGLSPRPYDVNKMYLGYGPALPIDMTYDMFCARYNCTSADIDRARLEIKTMPLGPYGLTDPLWQTMYEIDVEELPVVHKHSWFVPTANAFSNMVDSLSETIGSLVFAPILEEVAKRIMPWSSALLGLLEAFRLREHGYPVSAQLCRVGLHVGLGALSLPLAVPLHIVWNAIALFSAPTTMGWLVGLTPAVMPRLRRNLDYWVFRFGPVPENVNQVYCGYGHLSSRPRRNRGNRYITASERAWGSWSSGHNGTRVGPGYRSFSIRAANGLWRFVVSGDAWACGQCDWKVLELFVPDPDPT